jgi:GntR family transcriptional regulator/MocR family aminotransferase
MAKTRPAFSFPLPPKQVGVPAYLWLCDVIRSGILAGHLAPGTRLPATRDLAKQYDLSRGTIVAAFEQLRAEGYTAPRTGSGTYVNKTIVAGSRLNTSCATGSLLRYEIPRSPRSRFPTNWRYWTYQG